MKLLRNFIQEGKSSSKFSKL